MLEKGCTRGVGEGWGQGSDWREGAPKRGAGWAGASRDGDRRLEAARMSLKGDAEGVGVGLGEKLERLVGRTRENEKLGDLWGGA